MKNQLAMETENLRILNFAHAKDEDIFQIFSHAQLLVYTDLPIITTIAEINIVYSFRRTIVENRKSVWFWLSSLCHMLFH